MDQSPLLDELRNKLAFFDQFCSAWISEYRQRGGCIHCAKGCSGCCNLVVNCTVAEALLVARALTPEQYARLDASIPVIRRCADQAGSLKEWLAAYRDQAGPCPFLEQDGSCGVYQVRPFSCRSLLSTREPHWCTTDFAALDSQQKQAFMETLDRSAVAFPTHYAATPQELGQELELTILRDMEQQYGCSLLGNLPWLVWLIREHRLNEQLDRGAEALRSYLTTNGLHSPYLTMISA